VTRRIAAPAGIALVALVCGALAIEGVLRAADLSYPDFFRDDPVIGRSLRPGAHGWWRTEGTAYVEINADGMRDRPHAIEKPRGTLRIAVLGDSQAAAFEVSREATFWVEIERRLGDCPAVGGRAVEVLGFGLGGAGTAQELLILRERVWKYRPDVVVLAFDTRTDVGDNVRAIKGSSRAPYYVYAPDGSLVLDPEFLAKRERMGEGPLEELRLWLFNHSRLAQVAARARRELRALRRDEAAAPSPAPNAELERQIFATPTLPVWQRAWGVTEDLLREFARDVRAKGAALLVATTTQSIQVHPDQGERERYAAAIGVPDLLYPDRRIEALARSESIPFVMLAPPLGAWAAEQDTCVHGFANATPCGGHWNENGHRLAGEEIAAALCRDVLGAAPPVDQAGGR
jgi:hypothetical protein